jgi:hypothetical protein
LGDVRLLINEYEPARACLAWYVEREPFDRSAGVEIGMHNRMQSMERAPQLARL